MGRGRSNSNSRSKSRSPRSRSRSRSRSGGRYEEGYRVHVSDLGMHPEKREIERAFEKFGPINEIWLARNPPCFAFVKFKHKDDSLDAIRDMNGTELCGNRIRVSEARPRTIGGRPRGFNPDLRCYSCGETGHFSRDCNFLSRRRFRSRSPGPRNNNFNNRGRSRSRSPRRRRYSRRSRSRSRSPAKRSRSGSRDKAQNTSAAKGSASPS